MRTVLLFKESSMGVCLFKDHYKEMIPFSQTEISSSTSPHYWHFKLPSPTGRSGILLHTNHILQLSQETFSYNGKLAIIATEPTLIALYVTNFCTEQTVPFVWQQLMDPNKVATFFPTKNPVISAALEYKKRPFFILDPLIIQNHYFSKEIVESIL